MNAIIATYHLPINHNPKRSKEVEPSSYHRGYALHNTLNNSLKSKV